MLAHAAEKSLSQPRLRCPSDVLSDVLSEIPDPSFKHPPALESGKSPRTLWPWRWPLHWQILLGLLVGTSLGLVSAMLALSAAEQQGDLTLAKSLATERYEFVVYDLLGDLFLNGLKLIIVPIVTSSIILAVVSIAQRDNFGRLGLKTLAYYLCTSFIAIMIGLVLVNLVQPGFDSAGTGILVGEDISGFADEDAAVQSKVAGMEAGDFLNVFREMVPANLISAAAEGQLLGLIVVSMLVGFFLAHLHNYHREAIKPFVEAVYELTLKVTDLVLKLAPVGVASLIAAVVAEQYAKLAPEERFADFLTGIVSFALVTLVALILHFVVTMPVILLFIARVNPLRHYRAMTPALLTAFSTASSSATLPVTLDCVERRAGVSNGTAGFVLPLGATVNMDGTALYECVAATFICQCFGIELGFGQQAFVVIAALLTSIGVAGVPSASLVAIAVILQSVQGQLSQQGIEVALVSGMALLFVFDRPLDMCRTAVNIFSDSVGAVTIAKTEGETVLENPSKS
jgi:Na+/H+-dicarboxylate symporter